MSVGYVMEVDPDRVEELARQLEAVGEGLERVAQGAAHAWRRAAAASGGAALRAAAEESGVRWGGDLCATGELARGLGLATAGAAAAYREVEAVTSRVWAVRIGMAGRGAGLAP